ncbi:MAG: hypothetical protein ABI207_05075, partial [Crocinitomicaceae bacterium]
WGIISALAYKDPGLTAYASYYYWVVILLNVGTLFGAYQMWNRKKTGLYLWTIAEIASVVLMWVVIKGYLASTVTPIAASEVEGFEGLAAGGNALVDAAMNMILILGSVFPGIFVLLYWLNAKHLK